MKKIIIILTAVFVFPSILYAQNQDNGYYYHMMGPWSWFGMLLGSIFFILVIAAIAWVVYLALKRSGKDQQPDTSLDILNKRYARGEITKEEYERIKKDIAG